MKVVVKSVFKENEFDAKDGMRGAQILDILLRNEGIVETWYFGLMYLQDNEEVWIDKSKKPIRELKQNAQKLIFKVKFFPEDVGEELLEEVTMNFFFEQLKGEILREEIFCSGTTAVLLASLILQVKYGDYSEDKENKIRVDRLLPKRILNEQKMGDSDWIKNLTNMWTKHEGLDKEDALMEYLKIVQNLDMYGVKYFPITNKKGTQVLLGITAYGLNIYEESNKLTPKINFPWSEIKQLKFKDRKFIIQLVDTEAKDFVFMTRSPKTSKIILNLGVGNHMLYVKRRKPDSPELAKLKEKARLHREHKAIQKQKLNSEKALREELQKREKDLMIRLQQLQEERDNKNKDLLEAQERIAKLTQQLEELQRNKEILEQQRNELNEMMKKLEQEHTMEAMEREKLQEEIRSKQEEIAKRDAETRRLQEEVEEAKRKEEEARQQQMEEARRAEEERKRWEEEQEEKLRQAEAQAQAQAQAKVEDLPEVNIKEDLQEQLRILQAQLDATKKADGVETQEEKIHRQNVAEGRDKFKTLKNIRSGNTKRRTDMFENM